MIYDATEIDDLLKEFEPLIHKTIQRLNIKQNNADYEDFFQELRLQLIKIYCSFDGKPLVEDTERYKFTAYASRGLYWHCVNLLKKEYNTSFQTIEDGKIDWFMQKDKTTKSNFETNIHIEEFFRLAEQRLSKQDYKLLLYLAEEKYTEQELADLMNVSRSTIYQRKKRIKARLSGIKKCLIN